MHRGERTSLTRGTDEESVTVYNSYDSWWYKIQQKKLWIALAVVVVLAVVGAIVLVVALSVSLSDDGDDNKGVQNVYESVTSANIQKHLAKLFATANNLTNNTVLSRSVRNGYNDSAAYVIQQLEQVVGKDFCEVSTQDFVVPVYQQFANPKLVLTSIPGNVSGWTPLTYQYGVDFLGMRYGGNGTFDITAPISIVSNVGCSASDYAGVAPNSIALIQRGGNCTFYNKGILAEQAQAAAILFYNTIGTTVITSSRIFDSTWLPHEPLVQIPSLGISYSVGNTLRSFHEQGSVELNLVSSSQVTLAPTFNVFCTTKNGDPNNIVMAGAHLDSVPEGPGVNDNGSGSSSVLELAVQMSRLGITPKNKVTFAWWGAEELGLLGSRYFVNSILNTTTEKEIVAYLNFDMLGSPNYIPQIHNGSDTPANVQNGSVVIQHLFEKFFNTILKKPYELTGMGGGSDYYPFVLYTNIAAGGLATGASQIKTMDQRATFGGLADVQLDTCYHMPCDTLDNINPVCLQDMARAAAYVLQSLALQDNVRKYIYGSD